ISPQLNESPTVFPQDEPPFIHSPTFFPQDGSPFIQSPTTPSNSGTFLSESNTPSIAEPISIVPEVIPIVSEFVPVIPELTNPLDRPSSPHPSEDPFADPPGHEEELESISLSRTSSHTLSLNHAPQYHDDNESSMSDWT